MINLLELDQPQGFILQQRKGFLRRGHNSVVESLQASPDVGEGRAKLVGHVDQLL
jgi:hypothetical protein